MTNASPCVGTCKLDPETGWCLGCARTGDEIAGWGSRTQAARAAIWAALPDRFAQLGVACRRLPWDTDEIRDFVICSLRDVTGTWVTGVVGAVAEFTAPPGSSTRVSRDGQDIVAVTDGGALRFAIDDDVRALTFDPPETPPARQRILLAVTRERGRPPAASTVSALGQDTGAIDAEARQAHLFDLGLGRKEARFCLRCGPGAALDALASVCGTRPDEALPRIGATLVARSPTRVVESALGRIEVATPIPSPGSSSPAGPHTHLLPDHLATGRALPAGMELPRAYLPGALFYPAR